MGQERAGHKVPARAGLADFSVVPAGGVRRMALWLPVLMGIGIWAYFALDREPDPRWCWLAAPPLAALLSGTARQGGMAAMAAAAALSALSGGFALAVWSTQRAAAPVLPAPVQETVEGRVRELTRARSGAPRVLLDDVTVYGLDPGATPVRVRVTLLAADRDHAPRPGTRIRVFARLSPPGEPVEPGAFDFRLRAYFDRIGAVGYARGPALTIESRAAAGPLDRAAMWLAERRVRISDALVAALPGRQGAFAAALVAGDRSHIAEADNESLRISSLAHLLSISGLHIGLLTGLVYAAVRLVLATLPRRISGVRARKAAALLALAAGAGYLALSGAEVATRRAFVMAAVAFTAVLLDRPAITLRGLAFAAAVVLAIRPVSLLDAGFQMSFAATAALVGGYEGLRRWRQARRAEGAADGRRAGRGIGRRAGLYLAGLLFTSLLAGGATAPYAAYHFNRVSPYGLAANLAAVPAMGAVIAPAAVAAGLLAPAGLAGPPLHVMGAGIEFVMQVSDTVAALPGASRPVREAPGVVLGLVTLGGLWLVLWQGRVRIAGAAAVVAALGLWDGGPPRPDVLVAPGGRLVGVMGPEGRALDHARAQSFAAESWLRRDGDGATQKDAAARTGLTRGKGWAAAVLSNGWRLEVRHDRQPPADVLAKLCRPRTVLVVRHGAPQAGPCRYFGRDDLARMGALAIWADGDGLRLEAARDPGRDRPWSPAPVEAGDATDPE